MKTENSLDLEQLSKMVVQDREGREHKISEYWQEQLTVFVYVRQFG